MATRERSAQYLEPCACRQVSIALSSSSARWPTVSRCGPITSAPGASLRIWRPCASAGVGGELDVGAAGRRAGCRVCRSGSRPSAASMPLAADAAERRVARVERGRLRRRPASMPPAAAFVAAADGRAAAAAADREQGTRSSGKAAKGDGETASRATG